MNVKNDVNTAEIVSNMSIEKLYSAYWSDDETNPKGILPFNYAGLGFLGDWLIMTRVLAATPPRLDISVAVKHDVDNDNIIVTYEFKENSYLIARLVLETNTSVGDKSYVFNKMPFIEKNKRAPSDITSVLAMNGILRTFLEKSILRTPTVYVDFIEGGLNGIGFKCQSETITLYVNSHLYALEY